MTSFALLVGLILLNPVQIRPVSAADGPVTFDHVSSKWTVARNGTYVLDSEMHIRFPEAKKLRFVQVPLTWSPSTEKLQVVETRVERADGQVIVLGKEAIQDAPLFGNGYVREFSDLHRITIAFTDAKPGDTMVIRTRRDVFRPRVPGGFAASVVVDHSVGLDTASYSIDVPTDLPFQIETHGFQDRQKVVLDRTVHQLVPQAIQSQPRGTAGTKEAGEPPSFTVSTFRDWDDFAHAYASVLLPHAAVTPAIRALAARLTSDQETPRDQALAIYDGVRDHVARVLVPLDESRPEPNDADRILKKEYGDERDHAILLHALLAAKDIPSEFVLLNTGEIATIPDPPNLASMNHMILFLPTLNLYADSTLRIAPLGTLPFQELGKPAIHIGETIAVRREIPVPPLDETWTQLKVDVTLSSEGVISGTTETLARGAFAVWLRAVARSFGPERTDPAASVLAQLGTRGSGAFAFDSPALDGGEYGVDGSFRLDDKVDLSHGGYFAPWTGLRILPRPGDFLMGPLFAQSADNAGATSCYPGTQREVLSLTIPEGTEFSALPKDNEIVTPLLRFSSRWTSVGRSVTVTREFKASVPGPRCDARMREQMKTALDKIRVDYGNGIGIAPVVVPNTSDPGADAVDKN